MVCLVKYYFCKYLLWSFMPKSHDYTEFYYNSRIQCMTNTCFIFNHDIVYVLKQEVFFVKNFNSRLTQQIGLRVSLLQLYFNSLPEQRFESNNMEQSWAAGD